MENKTVKMVARDFMRNLGSAWDNVRRCYRQLFSGSKIKKLRWWLMFLLFQEPDPQHHVIEELSAISFSGIWYASAMYAVIATTLSFLVFGRFGLIALPPTLIGFGVLLLEVLHVIYDRPKRR